MAGIRRPASWLGDLAAALVLVGNVGPAMWGRFAPHAGLEPDPLDAWTRRAVEPVALAFGALAVFPFDAPPLPFQRWAGRAEGLHASPLGLMIHPDYGLWHAYRAALMLADEIEGVTEPLPRPSPCESCATRPCLSACPVGAFTPGRYDVDACASHLASAEGEACRRDGCRARDACPVGTGHRYPPAQVRFHMSAFLRARTEQDPAPRVVS